MQQALDGYTIVGSNQKRCGLLQVLDSIYTYTSSGICCWIWLRLIARVTSLKGLLALFTELKLEIKSKRKLYGMLAKDRSAQYDKTTNKVKKTPSIRRNWFRFFPPHAPVGLLLVR